MEKPLAIANQIALIEPMMTLPMPAMKSAYTSGCRKAAQHAGEQRRGQQREGGRAPCGSTGSGKQHERQQVERGDPEDLVELGSSVVVSIDHGGRGRVIAQDGEDDQALEVRRDRCPDLPLECARKRPP